MEFTLEQIDAYIEALMLNAAALIRESQILYDNDAYARAFCLAHLAREEIAKTLMLQATGVRILAGHAVDFKKLDRRLRNHKQKLIAETMNNAVFCAGVDPSTAEFMIQRGGGTSATRNDQKNNSLYVGFENGTVSQPLDGVSPERALRTISLAVDALTNQSSVLKFAGPFATRRPISIPEILPEDIKLDVETLKHMGAIHLAILEKAKASLNTTTESDE
ncbi:AbiV family abortive infection protein [Pseudomonas guariconensis]|uniref:AbiV family abortive infection protein n=1 Tax=Pseudomonas guariconensis TaxID=1288410 RepID=UPI0018AA92D2|nr:AbiV family abortive infection protein [Pseudomonas guariconensis]MBF8728839.1 AbiV family abortive infection protein [Pseudomonas guariconensis]